MKVTTDSCLFGSLLPASSAKNVLDIGTGTGLLSLIYAQKNPNTVIDAIELEETAATQAKENVMASPWSSNIQIINADVKTYLFKKKYDFIFSNPPFYENELKGNDEGKNKAHHDRGLKIDDLFLIVKNNLQPNGRFCFLFPYKRNNEIKELINRHHLHLSKYYCISQSTQHDFFRIVIEGGLQQNGINEIAIEQLSIKDEKGNYTKAFTHLLQDYYLNF